MAPATVTATTTATTTLTNTIMQIVEAAPSPLIVLLQDQAALALAAALILTPIPPTRGANRSPVRAKAMSGQSSMGLTAKEIFILSTTHSKASTRI